MDRRRVGFILLGLGAVSFFIAAWRWADPGSGCTAGAYGNYCGLSAMGRAFWWGIAGLVLLPTGAFLARRPRPPNG